MSSTPPITSSQPTARKLLAQESQPRRSAFKAYSPSGITTTHAASISSKDAKDSFVKKAVVDEDPEPLPPSWLFFKDDEVLPAAPPPLKQRFGPVSVLRVQAPESSELRMVHEVVDLYTVLQNRMDSSYCTQPISSQLELPAIDQPTILDRLPFLIPLKLPGAPAPKATKEPSPRSIQEECYKKRCDQSHTGESSSQSARKAPPSQTRSAQIIHTVQISPMKSAQSAQKAPPSQARSAQSARKAPPAETTSPQTILKFLLTPTTCAPSAKQVHQAPMAPARRPEPAPGSEQPKLRLLAEDSGALSVSSWKRVEEELAKIESPVFFWPDDEKDFAS